MTLPLHLAIPETTQIHIHFGTPAAAPAADAAPAFRRHPLLLTAAAVLLFGGGYLVRGLTTLPAAAETATRGTVVMPSLPSSPSPGQDDPRPVVRAFNQPPNTRQVPGTPPPSPAAPRSPFGLD